MPWVKGQTGNPKGAPKRSQQFAPVIRRALREKDPETGKTKRELVALKLVELGCTGHIEAVRILLERMDGKVVEQLNVSGTLTMEGVIRLLEQRLSAQE